MFEHKEETTIVREIVSVDVKMGVPAFAVEATVPDCLAVAVVLAMVAVWEVVVVFVLVLVFVEVLVVDAVVVVDIIVDVECVVVDVAVDAIEIGL